MVLGVGSEFNGDDAAGIAVVRALEKKQGDLTNLLVLEGGAAPENVTGRIRRFSPELVILVDSADMDLPPGAIAWLDLNEVDGLSATTHSLPLSVLAKYLRAEVGCEVGLIGIQPELLTFGAPLSPPVNKAVEELAAGFLEIFFASGIIS